MGQIFLAFSEYRNLIFFKKAWYFKFVRLIIMCSLEDWKFFQSFAIEKKKYYNLFSEKCETQDYKILVALVYVGNYAS